MSGTDVQAEPTYRQATSNDAQAIADVIAAVVKEPDPVGFDGPMSVDQVRTWIARQGGDGGCFLAFIGAKPVGFAALDFNTQEPDTVVLGVWLLAEVRRRGIGTALVATFWGLVVAIPALGAYSMLKNKVDQLTLEALTAAEELLGQFKPKTPGAAAAAPPAVAPKPVLKPTIHAATNT